MTRAPLSAGSFPFSFSNAGKGRLSAVGMNPSAYFGAGRASKRKYFPFFGPIATSFSSSSVLTCFASGTLSFGLSVRTLTRFTFPSSTYSTRDSIPLRTPFRTLSRSPVSFALTTRIVPGSALLWQVVQTRALLPSGSAASAGVESDAAARVQSGASHVLVRFMVVLGFLPVTGFAAGGHGQPERWARFALTRSSWPTRRAVRRRDNVSRGSLGTAREQRAPGTSSFAAPGAAPPVPPPL